MIDAQISRLFLVATLLLSACGPISPERAERPERDVVIDEATNRPDRSPASGDAALEITIDAELRPESTLPAFADGRARPISVISDGRGRPAEFVSDELVVVTHDAAALDGFVARWNGQVLSTADLSVLDPEAGIQALVRIDATGADRSRLAEDLEVHADGARGTLDVSDDFGLDLVAVAAYEAREHGLLVGLNWLGTRDGFIDRQLAEAPAGFSENPFDWKHLAKGTTQNIGVTEAWRALAIAGKLDNRVTIAVLDGGFAPNDDFPAGTESMSLVPGDSATGSPNPNGCGSSACPWHGTNVAAVAAGRVDNGFGTAGTGGPVADLITIHQSVDYFSATIAVIAAAAQGADIINMSFSARVPAIVSWTVEPFNVTTAVTRAAGVLLFASAGNDGADVDAEASAGRRPGTRPVKTRASSASAVSAGTRATGRAVRTTATKRSTSSPPTPSSWAWIPTTPPT